MLKFFHLIAWISVAILIYITPVSAATEIEQVSFFQLGINETLQGNYPQAIIAFTTAIEQQEKLAASYSNRCLLYIYLEDYFSAKQDCTEAISQAADNQSAYVNLGLAYYHLGEYQSAIATYNRLLNLHPHNHLAYYNLGLAYAASGEYLQAIASYNQSLLHLPQPDKSQLATIYNDRGLAYLELKNFNSAQADFNRAIRFDANQPRGYYHTACVHHLTGNHYQAIKFLTLALQLNPHQAEAYINRGLARQQLGYSQAALEDLRQGAECYCQQGKLAAYQQALQMIEKLEEYIYASEAVIG